MGFAPNLPAGTLNVALSNFAKEFRNNDFVSDLLAPRVPVDRQSFQYVVFDRSNQRLDRQTLRAPGAVPQEDRMNYSTAPYFCKSRALRAKVPYEQEQYALGLGFSEKQSATRRLIDKIGLDREVQVASLALGSGVTNTTALSGTSMWDNAASNPIAVVDAAKDVVKQSGKKANTLILSSPVVTALRNNPTIVERFKYTNPLGDISLTQLSSLFGVNVVEAAAIVLDKGNNASWVWGESAVLAFTQSVTSQEDVSALKTFDWTAAPETVGGYGVLEFPDPNLDAKADIISVDWYWDTRITAQETIFTFTGCCAVPTMGAIAAPVQG